MSGAGCCVVLVEDEKILGDIQTSLQLVKVPLRAAVSVEDVKKLMLSRKPALVLARVHTPSEEKAALQLANDIEAHPELRNIPVVALYFENELEEYELNSDLFFAKLLLPVEFPTFAKDFKILWDELNSGLELTSSSKPVLEEDEDISPPDASKFQEVPEPGREPETRGSQGNVLEKRLVLAYALQMAVLEALKRDKEFLVAMPDEIPDVVARVTKRVCSEYRIEAIVD